MGPFAKRPPGTHKLVRDVLDIGDRDAAIELARRGNASSVTELIREYMPHARLTAEAFDALADAQARVQHDRALAGLDDQSQPPTEEIPA
jgi:hypothetical protein